MDSGRVSEVTETMEANLGNEQATKPAVSLPLVPRQANQPWREICDLPYEITRKIFEELSLTPVSQVVFGLTCRTFHIIFHDVVDDWEEKREYSRFSASRCFGSNFRPNTRPNLFRVYPVARHPYDMRMTENELDFCWVWCGWFDWYWMSGITEGWCRPLFQLLAGETSLWHDLRRCEACLKYKPAYAFRRCTFERRMSRKHIAAWKEWQRTDPVWWRATCRRCRVKEMLMRWEGRLALRDNASPIMSDNDIVGLKRPGWRLIRAEIEMEESGRSDGCELWEEVFRKIGI